MPLYEYRCDDCHHRFEVLQRMGEGADGVACPDCLGEHVARQFSTFAATTTGNGQGAAAMAPAGGCCRGTPT